MIVPFLYHIHTSLSLPLEDISSDTTALNASNSGTNPNSLLDPFIYTKDKYTFKLAARQTPWRLLSQATFTNLQDDFRIGVASALRRPFVAIDDPIPDQYFSVYDNNMASIRVQGANKGKKFEKEVRSPLQLRWVDLVALEEALRKYNEVWEQVKHSSLVDIWVYNPTPQLLLAKGSAERGYPFYPPGELGNSTSEEV